jgi:copper chaperone CopZ
MSDAIGPVSYLNFASHLASSDSVYLFVEYSSSASTVSIANCADKVEAALTAAGKTVTKVNVIDGVCQDQLYSECLTQVGGNPLVKLKYATTDSSIFYTFYKIEGVVAGDAKYFNECAIADLIS